MGQPPTPGGAAARVLELLARTTAAWTVEEVARQLGITEATARKHLDRLVRHGSAVADSERSGRPGRPRLRYRAAGPVADVGYQRLSRMLLAVIASGTPPERVGRQLGAAHQGAGAGSALDVLASAMAAEGFEPEVTDEAGGPVMTFHRCPYAAAATDHPGIVCALHRGFAAGILDGEDGGPVVGPLEVHEPRLAGCRLHLLPPV